MIFKFNIKKYRKIKIIQGHNVLNKPQKTGLSRIRNAFYNSLKGIKIVWKTEEAFRQEIIFILPLIFSTFLFKIEKTDQVILISSLVAIIVAELINTALEYMVDRISNEYNPLSGNIKDIGSALVLITIAHAFIIWAVILI